MGNSTQTNYNVAVPGSLVPTLEQNTARMVGIANRGYVPYQGQRVADWDPMSQHAYQNAWGVGANTNNSYAQGQDYTKQGINAAYNMPMWGQQPMQQYMSPYQQGVTDIAKNQAVQDKQRNDQLMHSNMIMKGAFGGTRQGIMDADANRNLMGTLNNIQTQGLQTGYQNAQQQFNADRSAYGAGIGQAMQGANQYAQLGGSQQQADIARNDYMNTYGKQGQAYNQTMMDVAYDDWNTSQNYDKNQTTWLNEQMRNTGSTQTQQTPKVNPYSQLLGTGIAAYGAYQNSKTPGV